MENEKRLIDANTEIFYLRKLLDKNQCFKDTFSYKAFEVVLQRLQNAPTVDAVEVVHARWSPIRNFGGGECYGYCTNCKTPVKADNATGLVMSNRFCHWCGAKMDGDGNV